MSTEVFLATFRRNVVITNKFQKLLSGLISEGASTRQLLEGFFVLQYECWPRRIFRYYQVFRFVVIAATTWYCLYWDIAPWNTQPYLPTIYYEDGGCRTDGDHCWFGEAPEDIAEEDRLPDWLDRSLAWLLYALLPIVTKTYILSP